MRLFKVKAGVRYFEDGNVNGEEDISYEEMKAGKKPKIPCVQMIGKEWVWCIDIDADTGLILNWKKGNTADVHYKVCDCCEVDVIVDGNKIFDNEEACCGYVPECLCPSGEGWGDYMIMHIDENGQIADWNIKKVNRYIDGDWK